VHYPIDAQTGLQQRPPAARFPVGPSTIDEIFLTADPTSLALVDGGRSFTYDELERETAAVAAGLTARGVLPGDRVAWSRPNDAEVVLGFIATVRAGAIWVGLNPRLTTTETNTLLRDCDATLVLGPDAELPRSSPGASSRSVPSAPAAIGYTSGTTGRPKGAVHTHQQLLYPAAASIATETALVNEVVGTPLPLTTLNLMLLSPLTAFARGSTAAIMTSTDGRSFAAEVARHQVTRTLLVPTLLHDLLTSEPDTFDRVTTLRTVLIGGAGARPGLRAQAKQLLGIDPIGSYGLSEAPTGVARTNEIGIGAEALPGIEIAVGDDGEILLSTSGHGEWAHCWAPTLGYWRQPEATANLYRSGALHTGDVGHLDSHNRLTLVGRAGDMINRGGANVAPVEVERALLGHRSVADAVVVAVADERLGQIVAAAIVLQTDDANLDKDTILNEIVASARDKLAGYKVPAITKVVDALPRTAAGKVDRKAAAAMFDA